MGLFTQARQDSSVLAAQAESAIPMAEPTAVAVVPASLPLHPVSPPEEWTLPDDWRWPPLLRGILVYLPAEDWQLTPMAEEESGPAPRRRPSLDGVMLCGCGCPLFWEAIGDLESRRCVECDPPPSRRMVEDLWLAEGDGWYDCVSGNPQWLAAAFAHLAARDQQQREQQQREWAATQAANDRDAF